jgi:hypothetical protein
VDERHDPADFPTAAESHWPPSRLGRSIYLPPVRRTFWLIRFIRCLFLFYLLFLGSAHADLYHLLRKIE